MTTENTISPELRANAGYFAAAGLTSDVLGAFFGASQARSRLKIQRDENAINKILSDAEFTRNMEALFNAQQDLKDKATEENLAASKQFRAKQAEIRVAQSERGISGQSAIDVQNDITKTYNAFKQLQLTNLAKAERDLVLRRGAIMDRRTEQQLGQAISSGSGPNPLFSAFASVPGASLDALITYYTYRGEVRNPDDLIDRSGGTG